MTKEEIAELIEQMPQGMDANDYIHELVNRAVEVEREACERLCLQGTGLPVQTDALRIITAERERIAEAIRARGEK